MDYSVYLPYLFFGLGVLSRVVLPYLQMWLADKRRFDWRYLTGQILAAVAALIPMLASPEWFSNVGAMVWAAAFAYGWASADIGRKVQKLNLLKE